MVSKLTLKYHVFDCIRCLRHLPRIGTHVAVDCRCDVLVAHHPADGIDVQSRVHHRHAIEPAQHMAGDVDSRLFREMLKYRFDGTGCRR